MIRLKKNSTLKINAGAESPASPGSDGGLLLVVLSSSALVRDLTKRLVAVFETFVIGDVIVVVVVVVSVGRSMWGNQANFHIYSRAYLPFILGYVQIYLA